MIFFPGEQATLKTSIHFEGIGLHTGVNCRVDIHPVEADHGVVFLNNGVRIPAVAEYVVDTSRGTTIGVDGQRVTCIEHLLAALAGAGVDNCLCAVEGPELPAMDGSAYPLVELIASVGKTLQQRDRKVFRLDKAEAVSKGDATLTGVPAQTGFEVSYLLRYNHPMIGVSTLSFNGEGEGFPREIAPARTFGLAAEAEWLRANGLALGAGEHNAIIVYDSEVRPELRFPNEFVRHKILDMLGDLALTGGAIVGKFSGVATGHWANVEMARRLRKE